MTTKRRRGMVLAAFTACLLALSAGSLYGKSSLSRGPLATYSLPDGERVRFEGRVVARLEAGSYVYLDVARTTGERVWVVTLASSRGAARGVENVRVVAMGHAAHFPSKRLSRSFDDLYFAVVRPV